MAIAEARRRAGACRRHRVTIDLQFLVFGALEHARVFQGLQAFAVTGSARDSPPFSLTS